MEPLKKAMEWANVNYPAASVQHKAAFANSVAYLITGASGGYGGPSLREHLVSWSLAGSTGDVGTISVNGEAIAFLKPDGSLTAPGQWDFDTAIAHCEPLCFDPPEKHKSALIKIQEREYCFDDDPEDLKALRGKSANA